VMAWKALRQRSELVPACSWDGREAETVLHIAVVR